MGSAIIEVISACDTERVLVMSFASPLDVLKMIAQRFGVPTSMVQLS
jgi:hypothetical protein